MKNLIIVPFLLLLVGINTKDFQETKFCLSCNSMYGDIQSGVNSIISGYSSYVTPGALCARSTTTFYVNKVIMVTNGCVGSWVVDDYLQQFSESFETQWISWTGGSSCVSGISVEYLSGPNCNSNGSHTISLKVTLIDHCDC
jgi:hypothetical protein